MIVLLILAAVATPPAMHCEGVIYAGVLCTAFDVSEQYEPHWETFVSPVTPESKPAFVTHGRSVGLPLGKRWTLIVMTVSDGRNTARCLAWARKRSTTGSAPEFLPYREGQESP